MRECLSQGMAKHFRCSGWPGTVALKFDIGIYIAILKGVTNKDLLLYQTRPIQNSSWLVWAPHHGRRENL
jgi:hypothetical protein